MKQPKEICKQNLKEVAQAIITKSKNGPRMLLKRTEAKGNIVEVTWVDVPADGQHSRKIEKAYPEQVWGVYDNRVKLNDLVADLEV